MIFYDIHVGDLIMINDPLKCQKHASLIIIEKSVASHVASLKLKHMSDSRALNIETIPNHDWSVLLALDDMGEFVWFDGLDVFYNNMFVIARLTAA